MQASIRRRARRPDARITSPQAQPHANKLYFGSSTLKEKTPPLFPVLFSCRPQGRPACLHDCFQRQRSCMLEIIILLLASFAMAKRTPKRRRAFSLRRVRTQPSLALGTLASKGVLSGALIATADGAYRAISVRLSWSMIGLDAADGPIVFGLAHSDYSVTEIKESLEAANAISVGNKVAQEQVNRLVRQVGVMPADGEFNDGMPVKTRLNWLIPIGKAINFWAYNDGGALLVTGAILSCAGEMWVKDSS